MGKSIFRVKSVANNPSICLTQLYADDALYVMYTQKLCAVGRKKMCFPTFQLFPGTRIKNNAGYALRELSC